MATLTTFVFTLSGDAADRENALVKLENRLGYTTGIFGPVTVTRVYTGSVITSVQVALDAAIPVERIQGLFQAMVNVMGRTQSGFSVPLAISPETSYYPQGQSFQYAA